MHYQIAIVRHRRLVADLRQCLPFYNDRFVTERPFAESRWAVKAAVLICETFEIRRCGSFEMRRPGNFDADPHCVRRGSKSPF